ncbi:NAD(P)H-dependent oxidoreductase [Akkermansia sp.]|uniref:NAD(P)H-dependent oxidoreductase n=1 Tax=Akkermansia sp. TaxID=1872421 RepID=UPI0025C36DCA|nr:NAD(P)H-dependent oxidoreductase [Akkermansia sp.]
MNISVILGHPYKHNFNAAIAAVAADALKEQGHHVLFYDLYREQFNLVLSDTELKTI